MAGIKLNKLKLEITKYIGIPYFTNNPPVNFPYIPDNVVLGKGTSRDIALKTIELANLEKIKLLDLSPQQIYNFQKKHHLGIDCSGLACHLLNFYFDKNIDARKTSADMLTSPPLSKNIPISKATTGDLIRTNHGHHVIFIIEKIGQILHCVDSSHHHRGVRYQEISLNSPLLLENVYRLN